MINRVILMGRLVADPELKTTNTGISVTSFRIAVDRNYVKAGEQRETDFIDVVAWRSSAEFVCKHFNKGSLIAVDGQLQTRQYQTKDGQNRTAIEVVADNVSFTGERRDSNSAPIVTPPAPMPAPPVPMPAPTSYARQQNLSEVYYQNQQANAPYINKPNGGEYYGQTPDGDLPF